MFTKYLEKSSAVRSVKALPSAGFSLRRRRRYARSGRITSMVAA